jgi:hypothetical protein
MSFVFTLFYLTTLSVTHLESNDGFFLANYQFIKCGKKQPWRILSSVAEFDLGAEKDLQNLLGS